MYQLLKMTVKCTYCKHVLIKSKRPKKKVSECTKALINEKELSEFCESNALMMKEREATIGGPLVGMKVMVLISVHKGKIWTLRLELETCPCISRMGLSVTMVEGMVRLLQLDQNYAEELNRHLNASVNSIQAKVDAFEKPKTELTEELAHTNNRIITSEEEMESSWKDPKQDRIEEGQAVTEIRKHFMEETQF